MSALVRNRWPYALLLLLALIWLAAVVWLASRADMKDWLPAMVAGLGLLVALLVALWTVREQRQQLLLNFAMKLWQRWTEPDMLSARNNAWAALHAAPFLAGRKNLGHWRTAQPDAYQALAKVNHFLADLNDFIAANMVERELAVLLFRETLLAWYCHLHFVSISDAFDFADPANSAHQIWFSSKVLALAKPLQLQLDDDFGRYQWLLTANQKAAAKR